MIKCDISLALIWQNVSITPAGLILLFLYDKVGELGHMAKKVFLNGNEFFLLRMSSRRPSYERYCFPMTNL